MSEAPHSMDRPALRRHLIDRRQAFMSGPEAGAAVAALARHLSGVLTQLEPACLGVYWPVRGEFNPASALGLAPDLQQITLALPFCQREPRQMHYRHWDGGAVPVLDECRIPTSDGAPVRPDVILAPCVGYTADGYRLGYGGGYFDRYLAADSAVTVVGIALAIARLDAGAFVPQAHDRALLLVVSDEGVIGG